MGTTSQKLTYLNTTKQLLKTEINKINNVLTDESTFRSYPEELFNGYLDILNNGTDTLWSNLEKVSQTGTEAVLEGVETAPMKIELSGNTSQDGTPTPDTPVEVKVVKGENVVSVSGINLWDEQWELGRLEVLTSSANFGQNVNTADQIRSKNYIKIKADTYYYGKLGSNVGSVFAICYDENYNAIPSWRYKNLTNRICSLATPSNAKYMRFYVNAEYGTTYKNDICINQSDTNINGKYYPYSKTDYPINLGDIELCKINTYKDYFHKDNGKWYVHKEIKKVVLDGSEEYIKYGGYTEKRPIIYTIINGDIVGYDDTAKVPDLICSHFIAVSQLATWKAGDISRHKAWQKGIFFTLKAGETIDTFKTWLSSNNVSVYYPLATPTETEITNTTLIEQLEAISKAKSVKDKTYITQTNDDLPFILDVEAIKEYEVN